MNKRCWDIQEQISKQTCFWTNLVLRSHFQNLAFGLRHPSKSCLKAEGQETDSGIWLFRKWAKCRNRFPAPRLSDTIWKDVSSQTRGFENDFARRDSFKNTFVYLFVPECLNTFCSCLDKSKCVEIGFLPLRHSGTILKDASSKM
jgi:hypothetical protein